MVIKETLDTDLTDAYPVLSVLSVKSVSYQFQATLEHDIPRSILIAA